ncbi:hypothetical protein [Bartonella apis]|uniref:hypothetical protein n=1 Tax=Bartonella apis TaxID=1686310 RepID=UPI00242E27C2|nr:hypothetical protein [Bartonella apis]
MKYIATKRIQSSGGVIAPGEILGKKLPTEEMNFLLTSGALRPDEDVVETVPPPNKAQKNAGQSKTQTTPKQKPPAQKQPDADDDATADEEENEEVAETAPELPVVPAAEPVGDASGKRGAGDGKSGQGSGNNDKKQ